MKLNNNIYLIGTITRDPDEMTVLPSGNQFTRTAIATEELFADPQDRDKNVVEVIVHNLIFWSKLAQSAVSDLKNGTRCIVQGKLTYFDHEGTTGVKTRVAQVQVYELLVFKTEL